MKILMVLMGLEIGGAETHVVELTKELVRRGHEIVVASNGGVYAAELEKIGVRHVRLPLHTKRPDALLKSYLGLDKLIVGEHFDIVHAHARIPAFVCGLLAKRRHFRFITSTHGAFKVGGLFSLLTNWGEQAVAVSCDLKQYLIENYHYYADNISMTINGIGTERFSADCSAEKVRSELKWTEKRFCVAHVSRMDVETSLAAFLLCDAAEALAKKIPSLAVLLVGAGTDFERLKARADEVNRNCGRQIVYDTGARTDIPELVATGDIFVGVSRAALEAMSMEKPVILAGAQGYLGIFNETITSLAMSTNFCCRGEKLPTAEDIVRDIETLYHKTADEKNALGRYNRSVILQNYSVARMTDDYLTAYQKLTVQDKTRQSQILVSGYYGFDNMGDDSLLLSLIDGIRKIDPSIGITVLTKSPKHTATMCGVRCINRFRLISIAREMHRAKLLLSGGGSLLQDGTSKKSLFYYVTILRMAKKCGMKIMIYANGLGPLGSEKSRKTAAKVMMSADAVSFREEDSRQLALSLGVSKEKLSVTADPAFLLKPSSDEWTEYILKREKISFTDTDTKKGFFIVSVKEGNNYGEHSSVSFTEDFADDIRRISEKYQLEPVFIPMHHVRDIAVTHDLLSRVGHGHIIENLTASELCGVIRHSRFVVGMRLHLLIFAASMGIPLAGIAYDPKISAFLRYIGSEKYLFDVRTFRRGEFASAAESMIEQHDDISAMLSKRSEKLRGLALSDCETAVGLAKKTF